ncbi:hypothetical protein [Nakamurella multipartita]|uniref:hypothetical protein n=1 Tax=Nakamurella multipartita TaxID=53461 RepID=UPI001C273D6B|nr:hypothetical protein [Nakamurella multipartita]
MLGATGTHEDVLDVEGDGLGPGESCALGECFGEVLPVVEVGLRRQWEVLRAGRLHDPGKPGPGQETNPVSASHEMPGGGQQRCDVAVHGNGCKQDGSHELTSVTSID